MKNLYDYALFAQKSQGSHEYMTVCVLAIFLFKISFCVARQLHLSHGNPIP